MNKNTYKYLLLTAACLAFSGIAATAVHAAEGQKAPLEQKVVAMAQASGGGDVADDEDSADAALSDEDDDPTATAFRDDAEDRSLFARLKAMLNRSSSHPQNLLPSEPTPVSSYPAPPPLGEEGSTKSVGQ